ncbi:hypothetical protein Tco_0947011 [Tanacetum coccineum]
MSNSNTNLQTQSSNALHNAIMEAGSKDCPPIELIYYCLQNLPYTYQWTEKTVSVAEGSSETTTERMKSTEIKAKRLARLLFPLGTCCSTTTSYHPQNHPTQNTQYSSTRSQQSTRNRGKAIVTSSIPTYDPEPNTGHDQGIQKPKRVKDAAYHKEKMLLCKQEEAGVQLNAKQVDWKDDTDDESDDQESEAHYMYMAQLQEVTLDQVDNSGPIFDDEPMHKIRMTRSDTDDLVTERDLLCFFNS